MAAYSGAMSDFFERCAFAQLGPFAQLVQSFAQGL
jgi:hypothetical protein